MKNCPACKAPEPIRSRNDVGHFKADGIKPVRMYQWLCTDCGHISTGTGGPVVDAKKVNGEAAED